MHLAYIPKGNITGKGVIEVGGQLLPNVDYEERIVYDDSDAVHCSKCGKLLGYENATQCPDKVFNADGSKREPYGYLDYVEVDGKNLCPDCHPGLRVRYVSWGSSGYGGLVVNGVRVSTGDFVEEEETYRGDRVAKRLSHREVRKHLPEELRGLTCEQLDDVQDYLENFL